MLACLLVLLLLLFGRPNRNDGRRRFSSTEGTAAARRPSGTRAVEMIRSATHSPHLPPLVRPKTAARFLRHHHPSGSPSPIHYQNNASKYWDSFYRRHHNKVTADWSLTVSPIAILAFKLRLVCLLIVISWNSESAVLQGQALFGEGLGTVLLLRPWRRQQGRSRRTVGIWLHESAAVFQIPSMEIS